ncbi:MAG: hypothetical protein WC156_11950 [Pedobacter sp.]
MCKQLSVTIAEAAVELATTEVKVLMLLKHKDLEGELVDEEWVVSRNSLDCLKKHGIRSSENTSCRTSCQASGCGCQGEYL